MSLAKPATDPDSGIPCSIFTTSSSKPMPFRVSGSVAGADRRRHDRLGSDSEVELADADFCFTSESGSPADGLGRPFSARSGNDERYSISLSARSNNAGGIVTPVALAVFRLITSLNLVGCSIGISATFAPRKSFMICCGIISKKS